MCKQYGVPVVMLLSGGYQIETADVIACSIENLLLKFSWFRYSFIHKVRQMPHYNHESFSSSYSSFGVETYI